MLIKELLSVAHTTHSLDYEKHLDTYANRICDIQFFLSRKPDVFSKPVLWNISKTAK